MMPDPSLVTLRDGVTVLLRPLAATDAPRGGVRTADGLLEIDVPVMVDDVLPHTPDAHWPRDGLTRLAQARPLSERAA
ncbi:MAG TPA: hypothetical protein VFY16_14510 [Gemmatimonadaceae bacterium]|nr:hypothetical protein [Gemmatimonadaceae bacterium]